LPSSAADFSQIIRWQRQLVLRLNRERACQQSCNEQFIDVAAVRIHEHSFSFRMENTVCNSQYRLILKTFHGSQNPTALADPGLLGSTPKTAGIHNQVRVLASSGCSPG
jgi:hypothetical protein